CEAIYAAPKCRRDSDCPGACICRGNGYCGEAIYAAPFAR
nr:Chain A, MTAbl13 of grafted MCoTI-II [synthetic construct]